MKKIFLILAVSFGGLLFLGALLEAAKSPEQKAIEAAQAQEYAARIEAERKEEEAERALEEIADRARDVLLLAYIQRVKDDASSHVKCRDAKFANRLFFRCGIAYGSPETTKNGLWEAAEVDGGLVFYAMNGKALRALEAIGEGTEFQKGHSRPLVDTVELSKLFEQ